MAKSSLLVKRWFSDPAAWPIIGVISGAVLLCAGASGRYLFKSPDVQWNKTQRGLPLRENMDEGIAFSSHRTGLAYISKNEINTHSETIKASRTLSRRNTKADYAKQEAKAAATQAI